jgi:hypothetical protein
MFNMREVKCRWTKAIDSRHSTHPDEGSFSKLPNGDDLETGSMPCSEKDGQVTDYEEVWRDMPVPVGGKKAWILKSVPDGKTWLGRIGGVFLALSDGEEEFGARREEWDEVERKWRVKYEVGRLDSVPSFVGGGLELGGEEFWMAGEKVELQGRAYAVLSLEDL